MQRAALTTDDRRDQRHAEAAADYGHDFSRTPLHAAALDYLALSQPGDASEREAEQVSAQVLRRLSAPSAEQPLQIAPAGPTIQRAVADPTVEQAAAPAEQPAEQASSSAPGLIVEDDAQPEPGQMRRSEFLAALRPAVCTAAETALAPTGRTSEGCPYLDRWFGYYSTRSAQQLERALRRYAPETASTSTARDYIPLVSARVQRGVARWVATGDLSDVPPELRDEIMGGGLLGAIGGLLSGVAGAVGGLLGGIGGLLFKAQPGGAHQTGDPARIQAQLSDGRALESGIRSRMEAAFGHSFAAVRLHTGARAASLATSLNARAFTIGRDVAFGAGEYQPGTPVGDALLAHELAHVVQQSGARPTEPLRQGPGGDAALEQDADRSAVGAVATIWGGPATKRAALQPQTLPRLASGLRLQRCAATPAPHGTQYEQKLREANEKLAGFGFGLPWQGRPEHPEEGFSCELPEMDESGRMIDWYDTEFWEAQRDPDDRNDKGEPGCKLVLLPSKTPAEAIDALFDPARRAKWHVDCAEYVQLPHFYALRQTMSAEDFNQHVQNRLELRRRHSTGIRSQETFTRTGPKEQMQRESDKQPDDRPVDTILAEAPIGSRVRWTCLKLARSDPYFNENTIKLDVDLYAAHGYGSRGFLGLGSARNTFTRQELEQKIADHAADVSHEKPDAAFISANVFISEIEYIEQP